MGGVVRNRRQIEGLVEALEFCDLKEIQFSGPRFTWQGIRAGHSIRTRLDRVVASESWCDYFRAARVIHLLPNKSDHLPILLEAKKERSRRRRNGRGFRFEESWSREEGCRQVIANSWGLTANSDPFDQFLNKIRTTKEALLYWSSGHLKKTKGEIERVRSSLASFYSEEKHTCMDDRFRLEEELNLLIDKDMVYWSQRAKEHWLREGDSNSRFFHQSATERRKSNILHGLFDERGTWCSSEAAMQDMILQYFEKLFTKSNTDMLEKNIGCIPQVISEETNAMLMRAVEKEEVRVALFQMHPHKAPGPDGFSPGFYQKYWDIVGDDVWVAVRSFLESSEQMKKVNKTLVCLIPKVHEPKTMGQLRPISLCNVIYKIGSKLLANRLKPIMDELISPMQSAFVPERLISDNTIVAYEVLHHMKQKRQGGRGLCALKLDMSKAYDRVEWNFLQRIMEKMGFCSPWVEMIMRCVSTVTYSFLVNGQPKGSLVPGRGLRQGDALSPYLFLFCGELFSRLITEAEGNGLISGIKICRRAPSISHLLFVDDSLIFCQADSGNLATLQMILRSFELSTGQEINFEKSSISFSPNVLDEEQDRLACMLGVQRVISHDKYLGLPISLGKSKASTFQYLVDQMRRKATGWKEKTLSAAGKEILIKSVLQAIPTYVMSVFELPKGLCDDMHRVMAQYWWGDKEEKRRVHWLAWEGLCVPKNEGGLGFRNMREFNLALLARQGWRIITRPQSLIARVLKARYFPETDFLSSPVRANDSYVWRSLVAGRSVLHKGVRFQVGNGRNISIWRDKWLPLPYKLKPFSLPKRGTESYTVAELMEEGRTGWNLGLLDELFTSTEAELIAQIPISMRNVEDKLIWNYTRDGAYRVRSGYHVERLAVAVARGAASSSSSLTNNSVVQAWKRLWSLTIPNKMKIFMWRLLKGILPTKTALRKRHCLREEASCVHCEEEIETPEHLFRDCWTSRLHWSSSSVSKMCMKVHGGLSIQEWVYACMEKLAGKELALFCTNLWAIWGERNTCVWNGGKFKHGFLAQWASNYCEQFWLFHEKRSHGNNRQEVKWARPPRGRLKMNIDGAFDGISNNGGIGVIIRDENGVGVAAIAKPIKHALSAFSMELEACRVGLKFGIDQGWHNIEIESDSILLVSAIVDGKKTVAEVNNIVDDCVELMNLFESCRICHVYREANQVADRLAHLARCNVLDDIWVGETPVVIHDALYEDISNAVINARSSSLTSPPVQSCIFNSINLAGNEVESII